MPGLSGQPVCLVPYYGVVTHLIVMLIAVAAIEHSIDLENVAIGVRALEFVP